MNADAMLFREFSLERAARREAFVEEIKFADLGERYRQFLHVVSNTIGRRGPSVAWVFVEISVVYAKARFVIGNSEPEAKRGRDEALVRLPCAARGLRRDLRGHRCSQS